MESSASELIEFLTFASAKGMINKNTAGALRAAVREVISAIDMDEWGSVDVDKIDVDDYVNRFERLSLGKYKPDSLITYKSRFKNAVTMFSEYRSNPSGWRYKAERPYALRTRSTAGKTKGSGNGTVTSTAPTAPIRSPATDTELIDFPYPLRPGLLVHLRLPTDLTKDEASRLSAYVSALATEAIPRLMGPRRDPNGAEEAQ